MFFKHFLRGHMKLTKKLLGAILLMIVAINAKAYAKSDLNKRVEAVQRSSDSAPKFVDAWWSNNWSNLWDNWSNWNNWRDWADWNNFVNRWGNW